MKPALTLIALLISISAAPAAAEQPAMKMPALDHIAIHVRDVDRSAAFYTDLFGLKQTPAPVSFARWLKLANGLTLHIVGGRKEPVNNERWDHFALTCTDMTAFIAKLEAKGIAWSDLQGKRQTQTNIRGEGIKQIFIQDPDGYWVEVNDVR